MLYIKRIVTRKPKWDSLVVYVDNPGLEKVSNILEIKPYLNFSFSTAQKKQENTILSAYIFSMRICYENNSNH